MMESCFSFDDLDTNSVADPELGFDFLVKEQAGVDLVRDDEANSEMMGSSSGGGGADVEEEEEEEELADDGFRTPTEQEMKIPMIETCPPAPRKPPPPPPSRKRKALFPVDQSAILADLSAEMKRLPSSSLSEKKARVFIAPPAKVM